MRNEQTNTLILNVPSGLESLNSVYSLPSSDTITTHVAACCDNRPPPKEVINNVYELPTIEPAIRYLHSAAGFPAKATWLKAIRKGSYLSWPLVNVNNVSKYFPESKETQKGHMKSQHQGVRSTNTQQSTRSVPVPIAKKKDIFISLYNPCDTIYTDQTGKFPHASSRGYHYQMIIHEINGNSTWVETMKNKSQGEMIRQ